MPGSDPVRCLARLAHVLMGLPGLVLEARPDRLRLSRPVLVGYMAGVALIMIAGQLSRISGVPISGEGFLAQVCRPGCRSRDCLVFTWMTAGSGRVPDAALGAIVIYAAIRLIDIQAFRRLLAFRCSEMLLALGTWAGVLALGILYGVLLAIGLSAAELLLRVARPHDAVLGRVPGLAGMHDVDDLTSRRMSRSTSPP